MGRNNTGTDAEHWEVTGNISVVLRNIPSCLPPPVRPHGSAEPFGPAFRGVCFFRGRNLHTFALWCLPWKPELPSKKKGKKNRNLYFNKLQGVCTRLCSIGEEVVPEIFCHCTMQEQEYFVRISNFTLISHNFLHRRSLKISSAGLVRKSDMS